jgi:hypothetical protein
MNDIIRFRAAKGIQQKKVFVKTAEKLKFLPLAESGDEA